MTARVCRNGVVSSKLQRFASEKLQLKGLCRALETGHGPTEKNFLRQTEEPNLEFFG